MRQRFEGRQVIVTGGAQGIGRAIVDAFVAEGAKVLAVDVRAQQLARLQAQDGVETMVVDLEDADAVRAVVPAAQERLGGLHVLVNCAAVQPDQPALDVRREDLDQTFAINVRAPFLLMQDAVRVFLTQGNGAIVNIASANAIRNESPESIYNASKAALVSMTTAFAHEFAHRGVRVNAVCPGETITPEAEALLVGERGRAVHDYLERIPMRRVGRAPEQAAAVLFLASDDASFITGQTLVVDGGELAGDWYDRNLAPPIPDGIV